MSGVIVNPSLFTAADTLNLVDDFGSDLNLWNVYQDTAGTSNTLIIPAGTFDAKGPDHAGDKGYLSLYGPGTQTILGAGVGVTFVDDFFSAFNHLFYINSDTGNINGPMPKIDTVLQGEDVVTLKVLADVSKFEVGQWVLLMAFGLMTFGYPQNNNFFEYRYITDIDEGTGDITLDEGVHFDYKDTWPQYNDGDAFSPDQAGVPTLFPLNTHGWDQHAHVKNMSINPTDTDAFYGSLREITWENIHFINYGHIPTGSRTVNYINCDFDGGVGFEFDKLVELVTMDNCDFTNDHIAIQSTSIERLEATGCTFSSLVGTPRTCEITDSTAVGLRLGPIGYGAARSAVFDNFAVTSFSPADRSVSISPGVNFIGGVFTRPVASLTDADPVLKTLVPDPEAWYTLGSDGNGMHGPSFKITDAEIVGSDILYTTTLTGSEPELGIANPLFFAIACPNLTVTNTTSGKFMGMSYPAAAGMAHGEYWNSGVVSTGFQSTPVNQYFNQASIGALGAYYWGTIVSVTISVTKAYTGVQGTFGMKFLGFAESVYGAVLLSDAMTTAQWNPFINLKTTGTRTITPGSTTGTQSGDANLTIATNNKRIIGTGGQPQIQLTADISGESSSVWPIFQIEMILDQGIT